jgi:pimeloyl-ACP methyl ester carboxylesterase
MKRAFIDTPEGQIHYRIDGSGEPLLLLHRVGLSSDEYAEMMPILGRTFRVIAMDILGCGESDQPPNEPKFVDYVRNVEHFLAALKIQKTNVFGHLLGGSIAVDMAATHPEMINKMVLWDCAYVDPEVLKQDQSKFHNKRMEFKEDGSHLTDLWKSISPKTLNNLEIVQRLAVDYLRSGLGTRAEDSHRALVAYNIEPKLRRIKCPTLLLYTQVSVFLQRLEAAKKLIPGCQTRIIGDTLPYPFWEKPEVLIQPINEFLQNPGV